MKVLELKKLKKSLKLALLESEFPIDWWLEPTMKNKSNKVSNLGIMSKEYLNLVEKLIQKYKPNFVVEEQGIRSSDDMHYEDAFVDLFRKYKIPYKMVEISENALGYLSCTIEDNKSLLKEYKGEIKRLKDQGGVHPNNFNYQQLISQSEYLQEEIERQEDEIRLKIRENWMMMDILELAREQEEEKLVGLFICDKSHFDGIEKITTELGIEIDKIMINKNKNQFTETIIIL
jgi:hypothetical protein